MDELFYDAIDMLKEMISIPSISREENNVADRLETRLRSFGLSVERSGNNLWCIAPGYDNSKPTLLLNSHIDTVKAAQGWTFDPFSPTEEENRIYGLGSNDAGASVVSLTAAFRYLSNIPQAYNLILLLSCEEEVSGKNGIEAALTHLPKISAAIVGEPTGMHPAIAEKGLMVLDCTAHGRSGHAARNEGVNAIYEALPDVEWLRTYSFPKVSPLLGAVKMSVTQINAGVQHNVVPDMCKFVVDVRSNECYSNQEIVDIVTANVKCDVKPRSLRLNSSSIAMEHPLVKRAMELGREPFGSPTLSNQALVNDVPCLKMGPGESSRSHTANEYVKISEIRQGMEIFAQMLDGLKL